MHSPTNTASQHGSSSSSPLVRAFTEGNPLVTLMKQKQLRNIASSSSIAQSSLCVTPSTNGSQLHYRDHNNSSPSLSSSSVPPHQQHQNRRRAAVTCTTAETSQSSHPFTEHHNAFSPSTATDDLSSFVTHHSNNNYSRLYGKNTHVRDNKQQSSTSLSPSASSPCWSPQPNSVHPHHQEHRKSLIEKKKSRRQSLDSLASTCAPAPLSQQQQQQQQQEKLDHDDEKRTQLYHSSSSDGNNNTNSNGARTSLATNNASSSSEDESNNNNLKSDNNHDNNNNQTFMMMMNNEEATTNNQHPLVDIVNTERSLPSLEFLAHHNLVHHHHLDQSTTTTSTAASPMAHSQSINKNISINEEVDRRMIHCRSPRYNQYHHHHQNVSANEAAHHHSIPNNNINSITPPGHQWGNFKEDWTVFNDETEQESEQEVDVKNSNNHLADDGEDLLVLDDRVMTTTAAERHHQKLTEETLRKFNRENSGEEETDDDDEDRRKNPSPTATKTATRTPIIVTERKLCRFNNPYSVSEPVCHKVMNFRITERISKNESNTKESSPNTKSEEQHHHQCNLFRHHNACEAALNISSRQKSQDTTTLVSYKNARIHEYLSSCQLPFLPSCTEEDFEALSTFVLENEPSSSKKNSDEEEHQQNQLVRLFVGRANKSITAKQLRLMFWLFAGVTIRSFELVGQQQQNSPLMRNRSLNNNNNKEVADACYVWVYQKDVRRCLRLLHKQILIDQNGFYFPKNDDDLLTLHQYGHALSKNLYDVQDAEEKQLLRQAIIFCRPRQTITVSLARSFDDKRNFEDCFSPACSCLDCHEFYSTTNRYEKEADLFHEKLLDFYSSMRNVVEKPSIDDIIECHSNTNSNSMKITSSMLENCTKKSRMYFEKSGVLLFNDKNKKTNNNYFGVNKNSSDLNCKYHCVDPSSCCNHHQTHNSKNRVVNNNNRTIIINRPPFPF